MSKMKKKKTLKHYSKLYQKFPEFLSRLYSPSPPPKKKVIKQIYDEFL